MNSITQNIKHILAENSCNQNSNVLIFSANNVQVDSVNDLSNQDNFLKKPIDSFDEEFLDNSFFLQNLSLANNIKFVLNLKGLSLENFISENLLDELYESLGNKLIRNIPEDQTKKFLILLFLYSNNTCLVKIPEFINIILNKFGQKYSQIIKNYFLNKQIIFFTKYRPDSRSNEFFENFIVPYEDNYKLFKNARETNDFISLKNLID